MKLILAQAFNPNAPIGGNKPHPVVPEFANYGLTFMLIIIAIILIVRYLDKEKS